MQLPCVGTEKNGYIDGLNHVVLFMCMRTTVHCEGSVR